MGVLVREVAALYAAYSRGEESPLEELAIQYADYAVWQRDYLRGEVLERQLEYWRGQLAGAEPLELPTDRARPAVQSYRGASESVAVDEEMAPERDLSRTPLFQVMFNMIDFPGERIQLPELTVGVIGASELGSKFDLTLYAGEVNGSLHLTLVYNVDLFEAETIATMCGYLKTLLHSIVNNPEERASTLPLLTPAEQQQLSTRRNRIAPDNPFTEFTKEETAQGI